MRRPNAGKFSTNNVVADITSELNSGKISKSSMDYSDAVLYPTDDPDSYDLVWDLKTGHQNILVLDGKHLEKRATPIFNTINLAMSPQDSYGVSGEACTICVVSDDIKLSVFNSGPSDDPISALDHLSTFSLALNPGGVLESNNDEVPGHPYKYVAKAGMGPMSMECYFYFSVDPRLGKKYDKVTTINGENPTILFQDFDAKMTTQHITGYLGMSGIIYDISDTVDVVYIDSDCSLSCSADVDYFYFDLNMAATRSTEIRDDIEVNIYKFPCIINIGGWLVEVPNIENELPISTHAESLGGPSAFPINLAIQELVVFKEYPKYLQSNQEGDRSLSIVLPVKDTYTKIITGFNTMNVLDDRDNDTTVSLFEYNNGFTKIHKFPPLF